MGNWLDPQEQRRRLRLARRVTSVEPTPCSRRVDPLLTVIIEHLQQANNPQLDAGYREVQLKRAKTLLERV
jgi:hypothetical protein